MNATHLAVALAVFTSAGLSPFATTSADASAVLVADQRYVQIDGVVTDASGSTSIVEHAAHIGLGGDFSESASTDALSPAGEVQAFGEATLHSKVLIDAAHRLQRVEVSYLRAMTQLVDDTLSPENDAELTATASLSLVFDVLSSTQVTFWGLNSWPGMFALTDASGAVLADGLYPPEPEPSLLTLSPGSYSLLFQARTDGYWGDVQREDGYGVLSFSAPEPATAVLLMAGGAMLLRRRESLER